MSVKARQAKVECGSCLHFCNDPKAIENAFAGLTSLGSGYGSTGSDDGLCSRHDRYLSARSSCSAFAPRTAATIAADKL